MMNGKQISPDDPRLTAYALGEMEPAERAEFEQLLQADAAAQRTVEEIRATVPVLAEALAAEATAAELPCAEVSMKMVTAARDLEPAARSASVAHDRLPKVAPFPYYWVAGLAAACFAVGFVVWQAGYLKREQVHYTEIDLTKVASAEESRQRAAAEAEAARTAAATVAAEAPKDAFGQPVIEVGLRPEAKAKESGGIAVALPAMSVAGVPTTPSIVGAKVTPEGIVIPDQILMADAGKPAAADQKNETAGGIVGQVLAERQPAAAPASASASAPALRFTDRLQPGAGAAAKQPLTVVSGGAAAPVTFGSEGTGPAPTVRNGSDEVLKLEAFEVTGEKKGVLSSALGRVARTVASAKEPADKPVLNRAGQMSALELEPPLPRPGPEREHNTETYDRIADNPFMAVAQEPLSTFSIDVDTAAYANVRRFIQGGARPPRDAVRIEELVNYFPYDYVAPAARDVPFAAAMEVAAAPWRPEHRLVRIGLKGREVALGERGPANLVFLLDVSGSMNAANKLPLVQESMRLLVDRLRDDDRVAIVVYAGASGLALPSTPVAEKRAILDAIDQLRAGGSTNGAMGIRLAYDIAKANFVAGGVNRIVLCTDGDFNVGVTNRGDLTRLIEEKARTGVFLTVLGFGMGNLKDSTLEQLADKGNGNYGYVDSRREAQKLLVEQVGGTLVTIAKDVKIQVEFNPAQVQAFRLIGYENRLLRKEDFNNDRIDAGEIGSGHTVTALYEVVPVGVEWKPDSDVDPLKYQRTEDGGRRTEDGGQGAERRGQRTGVSGELLTLKLRYKAPDGDSSRLLEFPLRDTGARFEDASADFKFAAAVAGFGMVLRDSPHKAGTTLAAVTQWANAGLGRDSGGYRNEFVGLVRQAEGLVR